MTRKIDTKTDSNRQVTAETTQEIRDYAIYINDLPDNIQSNVRLFADDTEVHLTVQGQEDADILQDDLNALQE